VRQLCANQGQRGSLGAEQRTVTDIARPPRIEVENGLYHVVARGNERKTIYRDDTDRERFLEIVGIVVARYGWRVLTYCLMSNHYHLLVQTPRANLARGMRQLNGVYAQSFNRRHGRDGHLFQGRYSAVLVQADGHLRSAVRYIVRNPLRAGMCEQLEEWRWSSHQATIATTPAGFLATDVLLSYFGESRRGARDHYRALVDANENSPRPRHPLVDGDEEFIARHLALLHPSPEHPRAAVRPPAPPLAELVRSSADPSALARAHREHGYSMRQIAVHLGCGVTTIHRRIRAYEEAQAA
jgi:REP element-mobilizing transposase RayT